MMLAGSRPCAETVKPCCSAHARICRLRTRLAGVLASVWPKKHIFTHPGVAEVSQRQTYAEFNRSVTRPRTRLLTGPRKGDRIATLNR